MKPVFRLLIMVSFMAGMSCKSGKPVATTPPVGNGTVGSEALFMSQWNILELDGKQVRGQNAFLVFTPGQVSRVNGNSSCNILNGTMALSGTNGIKFSQMAVTRRACVGENIETPFLAALNKADTWEISDRVLTLSQGATVLMKLGAVNAELAALNHQWELTYVTGPRIAFEGLYPEKKPVMFIDLARSALNGNTSCNGFGSGVIISKGEFRVKEPMTMTMMACPGQGENVFVETIKKATKYELQDNNTTLLLKADDGLTLMRFARR